MDQKQLNEKHLLMMKSQMSVFKKEADANLADPIMKDYEKIRWVLAFYNSHPYKKVLSDEDVELIDKARETDVWAKINTPFATATMMLGFHLWKIKPMKLTNIKKLMVFGLNSSIVLGSYFGAEAYSERVFKDALMTVSQRNELEIDEYMRCNVRHIVRIMKQDIPEGLDEVDRVLLLGNVDKVEKELIQHVEMLCEGLGKSNGNGEN